MHKNRKILEVFTLKLSSSRNNLPYSSRTDFLLVLALMAAYKIKIKTTAALFIWEYYLIVKKNSAKWLNF